MSPRYVVVFAMSIGVLLTLVFGFRHTLSLFHIFTVTLFVLLKVNFFLSHSGFKFIACLL